MAEMETTSFVPWLDMTGALRDKFIDEVVDIEFECGGCCKKAFGGVLKIVGRNFVLLKEPLPGRPILVKTFSGGKLVVKQFVNTILIPLERVCSIEIRCSGTP